MVCEILYKCKRKSEKLKGKSLVCFKKVIFSLFISCFFMLPLCHHLHGSITDESFLRLGINSLSNCYRYKFEANLQGAYAIYPPCFLFCSSIFHVVNKVCRKFKGKWACSSEHAPFLSPSKNPASPEKNSSIRAVLIKNTYICEIIL